MAEHTSPYTDEEFVSLHEEMISWFEYLCELYSKKQPQPDGIYSDNYSATTEDILEGVMHLRIPMSDAACAWLGVPAGTSYSEGADILMGGPNFTEDDLQNLDRFEPTYRVRPNQKQIIGAVALASACDEMIDELGGVSYDTPDR